MERIVLVTGGFDPLHSGHIDLFNEAKKLGDKLVVGVNSDEWLTDKKGRPFMPFTERHNIVKNLRILISESSSSFIGLLHGNCLHLSI